MSFETNTQRYTLIHTYTNTHNTVTRHGSDLLCVIEAMKIIHEIRAKTSGEITHVFVAPKSQLAEKEIILKMSNDDLIAQQQ